MDPINSMAQDCLSNCALPVLRAKNHLFTRPGTAVVWAALIGSFILFAARASEPSSDKQTKSKFLINFAQFTDWPATAFGNDNEPLIIGILGTDPFGKSLDKLADDEVLRGRHVQVLRFRKVQEIRICHILYISESEERRLDRIVQALKEKPVLTVSEIEDAVTHGVIIQMRAENKKIRLSINLESAKAAHLTLKSKLLRLGQIVEPAKK